MKIYCFGNEFLKQDSLAKEISEKIQIEGIEFVKASSPEELFEEEQNIIYILDVASGIDEPVLLEDLSKLSTHKMVSLHDFDLSYFLKLMRNMGQLKEIRIIAIPMKGNKEQIERKVIELIEKEILK